MNKEKIITILIGLFAGAVLAILYFGISSNKLSLPKLFSQEKQKPIIINTAETTKNKNTGNLLLISSPDNFIATTDATINFSGTALPGSKLVIFANADEKVASVAASGNFSFDIKLEEGENEITVTAIDPNTKSSATDSRSIIRQIPK